MKVSLLKACFGVATACISIPRAAECQRSPGVGFPMIGIADGESARVNALNLGTGQYMRASSCSVTLQFLDSQGQVLKEKVVSLPAGKASFLDLSWDKKRADGPRAEIRAAVLYGYAGGANPPAMVLQGFDCNIVPSVEVYKSDTGSLRTVLTDAKPLPPAALPPIP